MRIKVRKYLSNNNINNIMSCDVEYVAIHGIKTPGNITPPNIK